MPYAKYLPEVVESRGEEIYEQQIRRSVELGNKGKFIVIDIETGDFEVDEDDLQATKRALTKRSDAVLYLRRWPFNPSVRPVLVIPL